MNLLRTCWIMKDHYDTRTLHAVAKHHTGPEPANLPAASSPGETRKRITAAAEPSCRPAWYRRTPGPSCTAGECWWWLYLPRWKIMQNPPDYIEISRFKSWVKAIMFLTKWSKCVLLCFAPGVWAKLKSMELMAADELIWPKLRFHLIGSPIHQTMKWRRPAISSLVNCKKQLSFGQIEGIGWTQRKFPASIETSFWSIPGCFRNCFLPQLQAAVPSPIELGSASRHRPGEIPRTLPCADSCAHGRWMFRGFGRGNTVTIQVMVRVRWHVLVLVTWKKDRTWRHHRKQGLLMFNTVYYVS